MQTIYITATDRDAIGNPFGRMSALRGVIDDYASISGSLSKPVKSSRGAVTRQRFWFETPAAGQTADGLKARLRHNHVPFATVEISGSPASAGERYLDLTRRLARGEFLGDPEAAARGIDTTVAPEGPPGRPGWQTALIVALVVVAVGVAVWAARGGAA